ncbi:MAG: PQQ-dependent sugar dehydrogenase [Fimbriiglobus sp.]
MVRLVFVGAGITLVLGYFLWAGEASPKWVNDRLVGSPEAAPPYKLVNAFPKLQFKNPVLITAEPGSKRLYVAEQAGDIYSFENSPDAKKTLVFNPSKELKNFQLTPKATEFDTTFGFVFHPDFAKNRQVFVCYTLKGKDIQNLPDGSRISRFTMTATNPPKIDVSSEEILLSFLQGGHNGCDLHFGPDGMLYFSTGDAASPNPPDEFKTGQDVSDLLASILRIDVNRKDPGKNYAIPKDNPFVDMTHNGKPVRPEIWAYGFRNPWRMSFDMATGDLWVGDVGWELWEMIHKVEKGGNYGWSIVEGPQAVNTGWKPGPTPIKPAVIEIPHSEGASITGGYVYRGKKFPKLVGKYIFGDWVSKRVWAADVRGTELVKLQEITSPLIRMTGFGQDQDNELYLVDYDNGTIQQFAENDQAQYDPAKFPRKLSESGLFQDAAKHQLAAGIRQYEIASHQWQDYAHAEHYVALPRGEPVRDYADKKQIAGNVNWNWYRFHFPKDTVLIKTLSLDSVQGDPSTRKRIETQLLIFDGQFWTGYTYAWRDDQSDADLVANEGMEKKIRVKDPIFGHGERLQTWNFASRSQCMQCHHAWAEHTLGFNIEQLNRGSQLQALVNDKIIERRDRNGENVLPNYTAEDLKKTRRLADPHAQSEKLADRAKSYLHANCSHCHRFGGGGGVDFELQAFSDSIEKKVINAMPVRGTFDLPNPKVIQPGDPHTSTLYYRMAKFGSGRMPHIGSEFVDEKGVALMHEWITSLGKKPPSTPASTKLTEAEIATRLQGNSTDLARMIGCNTCGDAKPLILAAAAKLPPGPKRDLFAGYFPNDGKVRLGNNPRAKPILALKGDAANGKALFLASRNQCINCHKLEGQGKEIGPDLSQIGKTRTREHLLESLLEPSRRVEQQYQNYLISTISGRSLTGLVVKKDAKSVTMRDAEGKEFTFAADDIEKLEPSRESLMPARLLAEFTPQEAADLLEYLAQKK